MESYLLGVSFLKGVTHMENENRVLGRVGARELSLEEIELVSGSYRTIHLTGGCNPPDFAND
jgi:hypothetical protein